MLRLGLEQRRTRQPLEKVQLLHVVFLQLVLLQQELPEVLHQPQQRLDYDELKRLIDHLL
ncbi:hypothetical protein D1872_329810 [compost metagenome]